MEIRKERQYNQAVGKYKVLSSTAGVGSIIPTKWGGFIMPLSTSEWGFITELTNAIRNNPTGFDFSRSIEDHGVEVLEDSRFVQFLSTTKGYTNLKCFAAIPHVELDSYNQINHREHPIYKAYRLSHPNQNLDENNFSIPSINFPQWFISSNFELKELKEWKDIWKSKNCNDGNLRYFVPPRDPNKKTSRVMSKENLRDNSVYDLLHAVPLVLICPNGHISDIPWYKFFCASLKKVKMSESGFDLFGYNDGDGCQDSSDRRHKLKWITSRNQAESWGTLECSCCHQKVSLAGIMNIKPFCRGERPWETGAPFDQCTTAGQRSIMRVAMVTSNSIYYANQFTSLFIPNEFIPLKAGQLSPIAQTVLTKIESNYDSKRAKNPTLTKEVFWDNKYGDENDCIDDFSIDFGITITKQDYSDIKNVFLGLVSADVDNDPHTTYRKTEYDVFTDVNSPNRSHAKLEIQDVVLQQDIKPYFSCIKQINTLAITSTQLGFGRVKMPAPKLENGQVKYPDSEIKPIYKGTVNDVYVLPANQTFGEGIFFAFNQDLINQWVHDYDLDEHYKTKIESGSMGEFLNNQITMYGRAKFYLLHTFAHIILKELEFSCGYPTASLNERLYYSDEMCGVLLYTADGSEGSMGGLVWQGQSDVIVTIIKKALARAMNCASDPLCWENQDGLNRAACFSCSMVSETSCEHFNNGLDRRALVDETFGFFKDLI